MGWLPSLLDFARQRAPLGWIDEYESPIGWMFFVIKALRGAAARTDILDFLLSILQDRTRRHLHEQVITILGEIGEPAARTDILDQLSLMLRVSVKIQGPQYSFQKPQLFVVAGALRRISGVESRPDIKQQLRQMFHDKKLKARTAAAYFLCRTAVPGERIEIVLQMEQMLASSKWEERSAAADVLGYMKSFGVRVFKVDDRHWRVDTVSQLAF